MAPKADREEFTKIVGRIKVDLARLELLGTQLEVEATATTAVVEKPLSITDAAAELGVHKQTLKNEIDRGALKCRRLGRRILIPRTEINRLKQAQGGAR